MKDSLVNVEQANITLTADKIKEIVGLFIASQDVRPNSKELYKRTLNQWFKWVALEQIDLSKVTRIEILKYKQALIDSGA